MNPDYLGDSYDVVKRFFCHELKNLGYATYADNRFKESWENHTRKKFLKFINAVPEEAAPPLRTALFLDPDTGINQTGGTRHISLEQIAQKSEQFDLVFCFDQAFSRNRNKREQQDIKLRSLTAYGYTAMYYDSHACFLFCARQADAILELRNHLENIGMPDWRLVQC